MMKTLSKNKRLVVIMCVMATLLLVPLVAMQFTDEANWSSFDFAIAAILLFGIGFISEFILRKAKTKKSRIVFMILAIGLFMLIWLELAVGVFGTPYAGS